MTTSHHSIANTEHPIQLFKISRNAIQVMEKLRQAGFEAYLVGGAIRDMYLGKEPKDFDIATNATPEECKNLFKRQARIIGRRFQIVHVRYGREIIEVTTFRGNHSADEVSPKTNQASAANASGMLLRDNVFGNIEEDAIRRDFTCNALYYSEHDEHVHDFVQGIEDIKHSTLRLIGEPNLRYSEDPVRMLRAARFAAKLNFTIEAETEAAIAPNAALLAGIPSARLFDESLKLFFQGTSQATFQLLHHYGLIEFLVQDITQYLDKPEYLKLIELALRNTDRRIKQGKTITPAFLWAIFLWPKLQARIAEVQQAESMPFTPALHEAASQCISEQNHVAAIPKRFSTTMREIWALQLSLPRTHGKRPHKTFSHPRFRAAYDFLLLREEAGETPVEFGPWWTEFQKENPPVPRPSRPIDEKSDSRKRPRRRKPSNDSAGNQ